MLDLDETLVYSQRMEPGATPKGTQIFVRGQPFDMVKRPGLSHFLRMAHSSFVVFLYTMGDQEYTNAVLKVIDPEGKYFNGARRLRPTRPFSVSAREVGVKVTRVGSHAGGPRACVPCRAPAPLAPLVEWRVPVGACQAACAAGGRASRARSSRWCAPAASGA